MPNYSSVVPQTSPPVVRVPRDYNAATDFIDRHLDQGRGDRVAVRDDTAEYTYAELAERVNRAGNLLRGLGVEMEQRVLLCMLDTVDFPALFWGAIKIGAVPIPVNTLLTTEDYDFMLRDSRARALVVSDALLDRFTPILEGQPYIHEVIVARSPLGGPEHDYTQLDERLSAASPELDAAPTTRDDIAFWLYSSGSTGTPKGALHLQSDLVHTAVLYGEEVLGIRPDDVVFSAAKLFFAYGLGNGMTFPFYVGATAVLMAERPTPDIVMRTLREHQPTIFYGVPTLYASMLADAGNTPEHGSARLRRCVSAGEALPRDVAQRWKQRFGVDILDGLGSTEMLHIFLSNRPDDVRLGTSGKPVPGYELRIVDEREQPVAPGELGELLVRGPSSATAYWNNREKSLNTFQGPWTRTGDKYRQDQDGYYTYAGRSDDMIKASGIWVSPFEVEEALIAHPSVLEAAVIGEENEDGLIKPKAYVVLREGETASADQVEELQNFVKQRLAPYKYPRTVEFLEELPKTATGKIQRFKLRDA